MTRRTAVVSTRYSRTADCALVLAAHGSRANESTHTRINKLADRLRSKGVFREVSPAFHIGQPPFDTVLDGLRASKVVVVPVMTSAGYYSEVVLPRELARNRSFADKMVHQTQPMGTHPLCLDLIVKRVHDRIDRFHMRYDSTSVVLVGHGTKRHHASRWATIRAAHHLRRRCSCAQVIYAFLDDEPGIETIPQRALGSDLLVIPLLIGTGRHALGELPSALGIDISEGLSLPVVQCAQKRSIVIDQPIGVDPDLDDIVTTIAEAELRCGEMV